MSKIAKVEYHTMVKNASLSTDERVLAQQSQHRHVNSPGTAETIRAGPELAAQKSRLNHSPSPHLVPSGK